MLFKQHVYFVCFTDCSVINSISFPMLDTAEESEASEVTASPHGEL